MGEMRAELRRGSSGSAVLANKSPPSQARHNGGPYVQRCSLLGSVGSGKRGVVEGEDCAPRPPEAGGRAIGVAIP